MSQASTALDPRRFRATIGLFATGVAVIVARAGHEVLAMTANAVSSASLDPMLVLFCPGKKTRFAQALNDMSGYSINFLRHDQQALSTYFAGGWKEAHPPAFRFVPSLCAPRLEGSLATIDCEPQNITDLGDHWLVVGHVLGLHVGVPPLRPLLFFHGRYRGVDPLESTPAPDLTNVHDEPAHVFYDRWVR